ncbi:MAG: ybgI [Verrucomicrobia bacterium]|jgi:dinuclear metal center YbgI/SA1388 family protein|nr:ybgI [Verrucomicrobiota bacterium]
MENAMQSVELLKLAAYCDQLLDTANVEDYPGAVNGLQVENTGRVTKIASAVDGSLATVRKAIAAKANLLIVHHGLFWSPSHPWTGKRYELLRLLLEHDVAVYSSHLPLDLHPKLGNNAQLCAALGLKKTEPFFFEKKRYLGLKSVTKIDREELDQRVQKAVGGKTTMLACGPEICRNIGVVTGGAGAEIKKAAQEGVDTFITGEGPHWTFPLAEELGVNVIYGGHYATETFGVKALSAHLAKKYGVPCVFLDHPSGL